MALWLIALSQLVQASSGAEDLNAMAIVHKDSGTCLQATASRVELQPCNHDSRQHWYRHERMIVNLADGRCLEWDPNKNAERLWSRGKVQMAECTGAPQQLWDFTAAGGVRNGVASSLCLEQFDNNIGVEFCAHGLRDDYHSNYQHFELKHMRLKSPAWLQKLFKPREAPSEERAEPEGHTEVIEKLQEQVKKLETKLSESQESHEELKRGLREHAEKVLKEMQAELGRSHAEVTKDLEHVKSKLADLEKSRTANDEQVRKAQVDSAELWKTHPSKDGQSAFTEFLATCLELLRLVDVGFPLAFLFAIMAFLWRQRRQDLKKDLLQAELHELRRSQRLAAAQHDTQFTQEFKEIRQEIQRLRQVPENEKEGQLQQVLMQLVSEVKESRKERETSMILLKQLQETVEGSDASSECTVSSWALVSSGEPCCFLPDTQFKMKRGDGTELVHAQSLFQGAEVIAANGAVVKVLHPPELHQVDAVLQLSAGQSSLMVSPEHRIFVPGNKTVEARKLEVGMEVILDGTPATLTSLTWKVEPTLVLKISFAPDLAIATWPPPILSKGSREKPRSRRGKRQGDVISIPDTEGHLSN